MVARSQFTRRPVNAWYTLIWLVLLAVVIYGFSRGHSITSPPLMILLGVFMVFSILAVDPAARLLACLGLISLVVPFYLFETYLWLRARLDWDNPTKIEDVVRLRAHGLAVYPAVFPSGFLALLRKNRDSSPYPIVIEGQEILPLAGIPDVLTLYCPIDDLSTVTYHSDSLGFRNPIIANQKMAPELALLGDSFLQGYCVSDSFTYAQQLSVLGPAVSYGINGTSALAQLAIFREYVKPIKPDHIIWFFFEGNDLTEYLDERSWPLLRAYLEQDHLQGLVRLKTPISSAMKRFIDQQLFSESVATLTEDRTRSLFDFLLLRQAREALQLAREPSGPTTDLPETEWREITGIWREVIKTQRVHGGDTTFVYIPAWDRFLAKNPAAFEALERKIVTLWSRLGADYLSLTNPVEAGANPPAYYERDGHFTEEGYRLTGKVIVEHLRRSWGG